MYTTLAETAVETSWEVIGYQPDRTEKDRSCERIDTQVAAVVQFKDSPNEFWKERVTVRTISRNGAGFTVSRPCPPGRLVSMALPMPAALRIYDHDADLYAVSGLVQYCNETTDLGTLRYEVGLAFIGKTLPSSYRDDPKQSYRISGMGANGLWTIKEVDMAYVTRRHHRHRVGLPTSITVINSNARPAQEMGTTMDVSPGGVSVVSDANAEIGDKVKLACKAIDYYGFGIVRGRSYQNARGACLHIQLLEDSHFPVHRLIPGIPGTSAPRLVDKGDLVTYGNVRIRF